MDSNENVFEIMVQQAAGLASVIEGSLDGSEQSLEHIDAYLSDYSTKLDIPQDKTIPCIAYIGNVIIANLGGSWNLNDSMSDISINLGEQYEEEAVSLIEWLCDEEGESSPFVKPTTLYLELKKKLNLPSSLNSESKEWNVSSGLDLLDSLFEEAQNELDMHSEVSVDQIGKGVMLVFVLIAGADGTIDAKEIKAFNKYLADLKGTRSELFKTATDIMKNDTELKNSTNLGSTIVMTNRLIAVRESAEKFFPDQSEQYCKELYEMAVDVAKASGGFLGLNSIDKSEQAALQLIKMVLQLKNV